MTGSYSRGEGGAEADGRLLSSSSIWSSEKPRKELRWATEIVGSPPCAAADLDEDLRTMAGGPGQQQVRSDSDLGPRLSVLRRVVPTHWKAARFVW